MADAFDVNSEKGTVFAIIYEEDDQAVLTEYFLPIHKQKVLLNMKQP
ncbi:hypothetical protein ACVR0P_00280 [Streptococcus castoreus]|nr:hypothetical protein [Streptococcus castoreus]